MAVLPVPGKMAGASGQDDGTSGSGQDGGTSVVLATVVADISTKVSVVY